MASSPPLLSEQSHQHFVLPAGSFFGETTQQEQVTEWRFVEARFQPNTRVPLHAHENASLYLILDGNCDVTYGQTTNCSGASTLVFHPPTHLHKSHWKDQGGLCFNVELAVERLEQIQEYTPITQDTVAFAGGLPVQIAKRLYLEFRHPDAVSRLAMEGMVLELIAAISRSSAQMPGGESGPLPSEPPRWLRRVVELLSVRYRESLSLDTVAASVDIHPSHLSRVFRQHYHCSVGEYIRMLRLGYVCEQLAASDLTLAEIALAAGFADQSHFTRVFRRIQGVTPAEYRRCHYSCRSTHCISQTTK